MNAPLMSVSDVERRSIAHFVARSGLGLSLLIGVVFAYLTGDWIVLPAMLLLWTFWRVLPDDGVGPGLQFSFSFHLFQIIAGVFYFGLTERIVTAQLAPQHHRMMVLAVGSLAAMFLGFLTADRWMQRRRGTVERLQFRVSLTQLFALYVVSMLARDVLFQLAGETPAMRQPIMALSAVQIGMLYLVVRRLFMENRIIIVLLLLVFETARGFTGFYSGFKEPVILATIAAVEVLKPRRVTHWLVIAGLIATVFCTSVVWLGIRGAIREDLQSGPVRTQTERLAFAVQEFRYWWQSDPDDKLGDVDALVDRIWDIYYTALALDRVPNVVPHENGAILAAAAQHVLAPRFLFPDKPELPSESDDVRKYTNQQVAGREQGTTIAFGYVIQSFIDYGLPWMFLPPLGLGIFLGLSYRWFVTTLHYEEILLAFLAVAFWSNLMPYNVAWAKLIGKLLTSMVYVGALAVIFDHVVYTSHLRQGNAEGVQHPARVR